MAMQATLDIREPRNRRQAMESQEWDEWRKAEETEMLGMVENCVYKQVARPKDKLVVGTKMLFFFSSLSLISLIADGPHHYHPACDHKGSSHLSPFTPYNFLSRCKFSTLTTRQPMVEYKRKIGQDGKVEKYKCRLVAQGFWQVQGVHYTKSTRPRQRPRQSGCFWLWQRPRTESCAISTRSRHF